MNNDFMNNGDEVRPLSWIERLKYLFTSPSTLFENLAHHPKVLFPILASIIVVILFSFLRLDLYREFYMEEIAKQFSTQGLDMPTDMEGMINIQIYTTMIIGALFPLVFWLVKAGLINGIAPFLGGEGKFKNAFSVIGYSYLAVVAGTAIVSLISLLVGEFQILTSLAILLPDSMTGTFLFTLLAQFDIFIIWYQVLAVIGISHSYEISRKKAAILVLGTWLIWILFSAGVGAISSSLLGRM